VLLPIGIYGSISGKAWTAPVVGSGSVLVLLALVLFVVNLFRRVPHVSAAEALHAARVP
jgi:hypothetical protein